MKALIFGFHGQDGHYLKKLLLSKSVEVVTVSRHEADIIGDVKDFSFVEEVIQKHVPNFIFHLAANSTVAHKAIFDNNNAVSNGTVNILEAVYRYKVACKVFLAGSAMQFKNEGTPINELTQFDPSSPYSVARIHSVYLARYYREHCSVRVYVGYLFNHDSPLRTERHFNQKIVQAAIRIKNGEHLTLDLGDLSIRKEFNFAGDVVEAMWCLVNQNDKFEAVIGCGVTHSLQDWVEYCFERLGLNWRDHVVSQVPFKNDYKCLVSDPSLMMSLGWRPRVSMEKLADLMLGDA